MSYDKEDVDNLVKELVTDGKARRGGAKGQKTVRRNRKLNSVHKIAYDRDRLGKGDNELFNIEITGKEWG